MLRLSPFAACLLLTGSAFAQADFTPAATAGLGAPLLPGLRGPRQNVQFSAGMMTAGRLGTAAYLSPIASYRLTPRLTVFGGLTYLRVTPGPAFYPTAAPDHQLRPWAGYNQFLLQGGAQYAVSPRLALTGTAWKEIPNGQPRINPYAGFGSMGSGMSLRADYLITENFSISGGLRMSNGQGTAFPGYVPGLSGGFW
ncbi:hypothetical protein [Hymenobacter psychrotolerans]|uniref:Outer membrane protein beta-barrel domain-containing protein n=1 Tax=Hymenobacter psychrotolerans DSM 18569 TaxID=1121959 RepID=A0A1M7AZP9_9BACT|nr:hypothetical protein [Hymenobacter psychrotolerans]SHL48086.1 hypothetical protein SAMN02746009_02812 [Hymenobacter psychrotolerans DSM 18569]